MEAIYMGIYNMIGTMILVMILSGGLKNASPDLLKGDVDEEDVNLLAAAMELENGSGGDECLLLTGSVILNRAYYCKWCPDTIYGVLHQKGQYASNTVKKLYTVKVPDHVKLLAKYLLIFGPICPHDVVYQSQNSRLGSQLYKKIKTTSGWEYFAYD